MYHNIFSSRAAAGAAAVAFGAAASAMLLLAPTASADPTGPVAVSAGLLSSISGNVYATGCEYQLSVPVGTGSQTRFEVKQGGGAWVDLGLVTPSGGTATRAFTPAALDTYEFRARQNAVNSPGPNTTITVDKTGIGSGQLCVPGF